MWPLIGCIAGALVLLGAVAYIFFKNTDSTAPISLDDIVGERCTVLEDIDTYAGCGLVKVRKTQWSARGVDDDDIFEAGEVLTVVAIDGVRLICRR
ncbi:MAG: hypothetical protein E7617_03530 [Ruminococcaceae bacterium]|nr:hypothetical protein [Oscillospiraceae bacterium]